MTAVVFTELLPINDVFSFHILPAVGILDLIVYRRVSKFWYHNVLWCVRSLPSLHPRFPLPCDLSEMPNLTALDLRYNESLVDQDMEMLTKIQFINLSRNTFIGDRGLTKLTNLRALSVSYNRIITEQAMPYLRSLTHIDPRKCNITEYPDKKCPSLLLPCNQKYRRLFDGDDHRDDSDYHAKCDDKWVLAPKPEIRHDDCCGGNMTFQSVRFFHEQCSHTLDTTLGFGTLLKPDKYS